MGILHSKYTKEKGIHSMVSFHALNEADRLANVLTPRPASEDTDVEKIIRQLDDNTLYLITSIVPFLTVDVGNAIVAPVANTITTRAIKSTPGTIAPLKVVRVVGHDDPNVAIEVELAQADDPATMGAIGITSVAVTDSALGDVTLVGKVFGFDTSSASINDIVYVSDASPGDVIFTPPPVVADNVIQIVGTVVKVGVSGIIFVEIGSPQNSIDGDRVEVDFSPIIYTPDVTIAQASLIKHLAAHLKGIDNKLSQISGLTLIPDYVSGRYYDNTLGIDIFGTTTFASDVLHAVAILINSTTTFDRIAVEQTNSSAGQGFLGIYDSVNGVPTNLVLDAGAFDTAGSGLKEIVTNQSLTPGWYYLVFVHDSGRTYRRYSVAEAIDSHGYVSGVDQNKYLMYTRTFTTGALPTTFGPGTFTSGNAIRMLMRVA